MDHFKFPILMVLGAAVATGCWQQQPVLVGATDTDSDADTDSDTDSDADTDTDTDTNSDFEKWGIINLVHTALAYGQYGSETLSLSAVVYSEQYNPTDNPDYEGTFLSKNGIECEIYYHSGLEEPPPPEPPAEVDVGRIQAAPEDAVDILTIDFDESSYTVDHRTANSVDLPLPVWLEQETDFYFFGTGLGNTDSFSKPASLPLHTQLTSPVEGGPVVVQNGDGDFVMGWLPVSEGQVTLTLNFNLDWDDAVFICRPDQSVTELVVPQEWINEYTWGGGSVIVIAVTNSYQIAAGQTLLDARAVSAHRHAGYFGQ